MKNKPVTTCQICGRPVLANTGLIAHHGYTRPGDGWQTASCMGARHLPYEVSCDVLPVAIESIQNYILDVQKEFAEFLVNPPETILVRNWQYSAFHSGNQKKYNEEKRPDGFTFNVQSYSSRGYEQGYTAKYHEFRNILKNADISLAYMQNRLNNWVKVG
jgi:hypothetical protein